MHNDDISKEFYDAVERAAKDVARTWPLLDWEDLRQEMWVFLLERPNQLAERMADENPGPKLRKIAKQVATEGNSAYEFFSGQYEYGTDEVRGLLEMGVIVRPEETTLIESTDLSSGMLALRSFNKNHFDVIVNKYVHGIDPTHRKDVTRAIDSLTVLMNRVNLTNRYADHQGPGARKAVSNYDAIRATSDD